MGGPIGDPIPVPPAQLLPLPVAADVGVAGVEGSQEAGVQCQCHSPQHHPAWKHQARLTHTALPFPTHHPRPSRRAGSAFLRAGERLQPGLAAKGKLRHSHTGGRGAVWAPQIEVLRPWSCAHPAPRRCASPPAWVSLSPTVQLLLRWAPKTPSWGWLLSHSTGGSPWIGALDGTGVICPWGWIWGNEGKLGTSG